jgi:hypothetical protein
MHIPARFIRLAPDEMDDRLGPVVVHRTPAEWIFYCRADKITEELVREFEAIADRYAQVTESLATPTEPKPEVRLERLPPEQIPPPLQPAVFEVRNGRKTLYVSADLISPDMAEALADITAEQFRYSRQLPVIAPSP